MGEPVRDGAEHRARRVLVIDDDPAFHEFVYDALGADAIVDCVLTEFEALWILERRPVDVVVCDMMLGHTDGRRLLEAVRDRWRSIARVLITGFGDGLAEQGEVAAQEVIWKPCDSMALRRAVERDGESPAAQT